MALAWLGLGSMLLARLPSVEDRTLDLLNRIGVGAIAAGLLTFAAGWAGLLAADLFRVAFLALAAAGTFFAVSLGSDLPRPRLHSWTPWQLALLALLIVYTAFGVVATSAPVSSPDALLYHAADPALFERTGGIVEVPWNSSSYEPFLVEMLVLDGVVVWNAVQGAFAPFLLGLLGAGAVIGAAARLGGRSAALIAGAIFVAQPFMLWETTSVFVEAGLGAAIALASWNVARFVQHRERSALVLAGVFCGGAAGMKYLGLVAVAALVVAGVILTWGRLRPHDAFAFAAPALAVAAPWYIKNAILTGNPFYPHLFGGLNASAAAELERSMDSFGRGHGPIDLLLLPARLLTDGEAFDGGEWITPLFLAFAPLALLVGSLRRCKLAVAAAFLFFVLVWFATTQQARFLLPLMPAAAVLAGLGVLKFAARGKRWCLATLTVMVAVLAGGLAASTVYAAQFVPVAFGRESERDFLAQKVSLYDGVVWLNRNLDEGDRVAVDLWALLYLKAPYVTFGTMGDLLPPEAGAAETRAFVEKYGVTHIAVLETNTARRRQAALVGARVIARVPVRSVRSRTRSKLGPWQELLVYKLARPR